MDDGPPVQHIPYEPPRWDALYYQELGESLATLASEALQLDGRTLAGARALDIGCGRGELLGALKARGARAVGLDLDPTCAAMARRFGPTVVGAAEDVDRLFPPETFDVVISSHTLEHVESPRRAVEAMRRVSRRWIIIGVPNLLRPVNWFLRTPRYVNPGHLHGWDSHHLKTFLELHCDLSIVRWWPDPVILSPLRRTPLLQTRALRFVESSLLPVLFPQMMNTLVVLCDGRRDAARG